MTIVHGPLSAMSNRNLKTPSKELIFPGIANLKYRAIS